MRRAYLAVAILLLVGSLSLPAVLPAQVAPTTVPSTAPSTAPAMDVPMAPVQSYLDRGDLSAAERAMSARLLSDPADDQARFSLGTVQFFQAVERLSQSLYAHGIRHSEELHLPIPDNAAPQPTKYDDVRQMAARLVDDVSAAESTLAGVKDPNVHLPLRIGTVRLDFTGSGHPGADAMLWQVLKRMWGNPDLNADSARSFYVNLDAGDVYWLGGYCHVIAAMGDAMLAYDGRDLFDRTGQLFFKRAESPYPFLLSGKRVFDADGMDLADVVAFVHLMHLPLREPLRLLEVRRHLKAMTDCSRKSWHLILAETDDDHEWIPNPRQHSVVPHVRVTREMVDAWLKFLDQADDILDGKLLIPFWRGDGTQGVNLAKLFFTDPQPFDPILWIQGTGVAPALQRGPLATRDVYGNLERVFSGDVFAFGAWFN